MRRLEHGVVAYERWAADRGESRFEGENFVFDKRVVVEPSMFLASSSAMSDRRRPPRRKKIDQSATTRDGRRRPESFQIYLGAAID